MAWCEYAAQVGGQCGASAENPVSSKCMPLSKCDKHIRSHRNEHFCPYSYLFLKGLSVLSIYIREKGSRRRVSSDVNHTYLIPSYIIHLNVKFSKKTFFPRRTKSDKKKLNITYGGE